jgi:hypothetical protein
MADSVTTKILYSDAYRVVLRLTNISDGTGESAVVKWDKSTASAAYYASDGAEPASVEIESCRWAIQGMASVRLLWDHGTDDVAMLLCGSGYECPQSPGFKDGVVNADPRSAGGTGDILLTTQGAAANGTYDITLVLLKRPD